MWAALQPNDVLLRALLAGTWSIVTTNSSLSFQTREDADCEPKKQKSLAGIISLVQMSIYVDAVRSQPSARSALHPVALLKARSDHR